MDEPVDASRYLNLYTYFTVYYILYQTHTYNILASIYIGIAQLDTDMFEGRYLLLHPK